MLAIAATMVVTGIEIFQVEPVDPFLTWKVELLYVIMLTILFGLGLVLLSKRSRDVKMGLATDDELSRMIMHKSGSVTFFSSLLIWIIILFLEVHTNIESRLLIAFAIVTICIVFIIFWLIFNFLGAGHEKQD